MTETTSGHQNIQTGGTLEIELEGNPSTGYDWDTLASDAASLARVEIVDLGVVPRTGANLARPLVGEPVRRRWRVTALTTGTARLIFSYRRSWEIAAPIRTHTVIIDISN